MRDARSSFGGRREAARPAGLGPRDEPDRSAYFASILGAGKLLGAIVITVPRLPRLKEWAYAGFFIDLTSAAISRAAVGDSAADILAPLGFLALVLASWALRPASRRLSATVAAEPFPVRV